jgi:hypothetical protein
MPVCNQSGEEVDCEMMEVFEKGDLPVKAKLEQGVFELTIDFEP